MTFSRIKKGRIEERRPIFKLIEVCKVKLPKSNVRIVFVNISSLLALQVGSSCLLLIPGTQRQPGDAFVVSLCHWEGLGNWVPHDP